MKIKMRHDDYEIECDAADDVVAQWVGEFHALVKAHLEAKRKSEQLIAGAKQEKTANAIRTLRFAIKDFENDVLA